MKQTIVFLFVMILIGCSPANTTSSDDSKTAIEKVNEDSTLATKTEVETPLEEVQSETTVVEEENTKATKSETSEPVKVKKSISKPVTLSTTTDDFTVDYLMGKFNPNKHPDFTTIQTKHASKAGMRLRKDTYEAFTKMYDAALKDGVRLKIISATRPFNHQKSIWEAKWEGRRKVNGQLLPPNPRNPEQRARLILMYSSMPGTSRHHWGTDIDLNDLNNPYFEKGIGKKIYDWLVANASEYGFCQVYSPQDESRPYGYLEEKWHWSYVPVARRLTNLYAEKLTDEDIQGFEGSETAVSIGMIEHYVLGINPTCK